MGDFSSADIPSFLYNEPVVFNTPYFPDKPEEFLSALL